MLGLVLAGLPGLFFAAEHGDEHVLYEAVGLGHCRGRGACARCLRPGVSDMSALIQRLLFTALSVQWARGVAGVDVLPELPNPVPENDNRTLAFFQQFATRMAWCVSFLTTRSRLFALTWKGAASARLQREQEWTVCAVLPESCNNSRDPGVKKHPAVNEASWTKTNA